MIEVDEATFQMLIDRAFDSLPELHRDNVKNVAIVTADAPDERQRAAGKLRPDQTLLGLYEGVPLTQRQGRDTMSPDVITLFRLPLQAMSHDEASLYENVRHTLWHEIAHYYGLDHDKIHELER